MGRQRDRVTEAEQTEYCDMVWSLQRYHRMDRTAIARAVGVERNTLYKRVNGDVDVTLEALYAMRWAFAKINGLFVVKKATDNGVHA